ncbi:unnamed protein product [Nippostrongylus brasiliensis]|uniref:Phlebovirus_G2 domain-containing protein n=1 Tax=Nippostrongylus brasiliensis TaxID=27835 RepID=A0A0N4YJA7_NIPBR|nr:unnamed protein product [Nippostrongylus brasiliensis]
MASVLKINSFRRDACIRLQRDNMTVTEIKLRWIGLRLLCNKESLLFTRNVKQKVVDSKRCPHMGSCSGNKCADVNSSSLLPELSIGNSYPGNTGCYESCGGPGCDCFCLSSGCLFYRIFAVPRNDDVYELFKCSSWQEEVKLELQVRRASEKSFSQRLIGLRPNIPQKDSSLEITLSVLSWQYLPQLDTLFISTKNVTALWTSQVLP